jgi:hypothetical protein
LGNAGPPTGWGEFAQADDERASFQASPEELPVIDIHSEPSVAHAADQDVADRSITASVFAISSPTVRSWFKRPTPLQIAPNQAAINLDDGGLVYSTDNRITAFHGSDPRHRQLIGQV